MQLFPMLLLLLTTTSVAAECQTTWPLTHAFKNNGGYSFLQRAYYRSSGWVRHPGEDWNIPSKPGGACNGDKGLPVVAVADGLVVYAEDAHWGGIVVQHETNDTLWYSQYGHIQNAQVRIGDQVSCGQPIAEIGRTGAKCAHLHFEIRNASHPNPTYGPYWSSGEKGLGALSQVKKWYENPRRFLAKRISHE